MERWSPQYSLHKHSSRRKVSLTVTFLQLKDLYIKERILFARDFQLLAFLQKVQKYVINWCIASNVDSLTNEAQLLVLTKLECL